jgi:hypothetical protein
VFVHHSVHIDGPISAVSLALARGSSEWFPGLEERSLATVGPQVGGVGIRKKVVIEFGEPTVAGSWTEVPVSWKATSVRKLFPAMTGKIELAPVDPGVTRLTVSGMYQPPLGSLGKHIDDAFMHRVADATVKDLAESISERLQALVRSATWS